MTTIKVSLSIGFAGDVREETIDIPDDELDGLSAEEKEDVYEGYWKEWSANYIDGSWITTKESTK